jgi:hypothetical protein
MAVHYGNSAYFVGRFFGSLFSKWIDGYTGDCLGQRSKYVKFYFIYQLFLWKFI